MSLTILLFISVLLLAYANGANDNFKGVATLWSSGVLNYKQALIFSNVASFLGAVTAYFFATTLLKNFSGKGLVPNDIVKSIPFALSIALGAAITILIATKLGFPISTTHSIVGGLTGAGIMAVGSSVQFAALGKVFLLPLILSPIIASFLGFAIYYFVKNKTPKNEKLTDAAHITSASIVCFAHGLNDAPKIISLLLLCNYFPNSLNFLLVGILTVVGSVLHAKKVATKMSKKITTLNHVKGLTANGITGFLVIVASYFGLPVSFTHISVGAIYGVSIQDNTANKKEVKNIVLSWVLTLPIAFICSAVIYLILKQTI
jgi:inorganic phosphate transporter, PiT family